MSLKKNYIYNILYQILLIVIPLFVSPYLSRVLGAEKLGINSFAQATAHYFVLFILLGVNHYGNREIAFVRNNKELTRRVFWGIYTFQFILLIIISIFYLALCLFIKENRLIFLLEFLYILSAGFDINWCCFGLEKFKLTVTRNFIIKILCTIGIFLFVKKESDLWIYTFLSSLSLLVSQAVLWPFIIKEIGFERPTASDVIKHIKPNIFLFFPVLSVSLYTIMDKLMLGIMCAKDEVGFYTYAERFIQIPMSFITALGTVLLPRASNLVNNNDKATRIYLFSKSMQFAMLLSIACSFGLFAISDTFVPWYYGKHFSRCAIFTQILAPVIFFTSWNTIIRTQIILPERLDKEYLWAVLSGAVANFTLNLLLIPKLLGTGASISTTIAQAIVCIVQYFTICKRFSLKKQFVDVSVFLLFGLLMLFVVSLLPVNSVYPLVKVIIQAVVGGIFYLSVILIYLNLIRKDTALFDSIIHFIRK